MITHTRTHAHTHPHHYIRTQPQTCVHHDKVIACVHSILKMKQHHKISVEM